MQHFQDLKLYTPSLSLKHQKHLQMLSDLAGKTVNTAVILNSLLLDLCNWHLGNHCRPAAQTLYSILQNISTFSKFCR